MKNDKKIHLDLSTLESQHLMEEYGKLASFDILECHSCPAGVNISAENLKFPPKIQKFSLLAQVLKKSCFPSILNLTEICFFKRIVKYSKNFIAFIYFWTISTPFCTVSVNNSLNLVSFISLISQHFIEGDQKLFPKLLIQGFRNRFKSRGQSVMNFSKWGQNAEYVSKSIGATEIISKIEGSIWPLVPL